MDNDSVFDHIVDSVTRAMSESNSSYQDVQPQSDGGMNVFVVAGILAIVGSYIFMCFRDSKTSKTWDKGLIPDSFSPTEANVFEIFIAAAASMVALDRRNNSKGYVYAKKYLNNRFPEEYYEFNESFRYSLKHVVKQNSLALWCNKHLSVGRKIQLINFLAGVAYFSEGNISQVEKQCLFSLISKMNLKYENLEPRFRESMEEKVVDRPRYTGLSRHYQVLGLSGSVSVEELKAVYRKLVKETHPDRFMNESEEVQLRKKEEFQQLKESYELILEEIQ